MPRALKVFRTPIGFHDAYIAAPTQKAALEAWGSDANLFARGVAEIVTDPDLIKEPLAHPGEVIKRLRGSSEDHFAALSPTPRRRFGSGVTKEKTEIAQRTHAKKISPRPSRAKLDAAENALSDLEEAQQAAEKDLRRREEVLRDERGAMETRHEKERDTAQLTVDAAHELYDAAIEKWRTDN